MIVTLGYLGLGIPPPSPDWGRMIYEGQSFLTTNWQLSTIPGVAVVIVGLALSLIGDGLADLLRRE
jgi:peptide/nickel transport system permease protein